MDATEVGSGESHIKSDLRGAFRFFAAAPFVDFLIITGSVD